MVVGVFISYLAQFNPSSVLPMIVDDYGIDLAQAGLSVSIVYIPIIIFSLLGPYIIARIGLKKMYILAIFFSSLGVGMAMISGSFGIFLVGRLLYGVGFGLVTPFIEAAIMHWYNERQRVYMNTLNALFPYISNLFVYGLTLPMVALLGNSWKAALAIWGLLGFIFIIIWIFVIKDEGKMASAEEAGAVSTDKGVYRNVLKSKEIIILAITFICDFISFSVISTMLPTYYNLEAGYTLEVANQITLIFPIAGIIGGLMAGVIMDRTGHRKPLLWVGQLCKVVGIILFFFFSSSFLGFVGVAFVGLGNCLWIPAMMTVPMDLEGMTPTLAGAGYAFITSCGFAMGFVAPILAGWMGEVFTLRLAIFLCVIPCIIGMIACLMIRETGPGKPGKEVKAAE